MSQRCAFVILIVSSAGAISCNPDTSPVSTSTCQSDTDCRSPPSACSSPTGTCAGGACTYQEAAKTQYCLDADGDGFPGTATCGSYCAAEAPAGYHDVSAVLTDCNDADATTFPGGAGTCPCTDGQTVTCNAGACNESTITCSAGQWPACPDPIAADTYCLDNDQDGYCTDTCVSQCSVPDAGLGHYISQSTCSASLDCNDGNAATHPGATEVCDGLDNDCDSATPADPGCACITGQTQECNATYCNPSTVACSSGQFVCPAPVGPTVYCLDADSDGYCSDSCVTQCSPPAPPPTGNYLPQSTCLLGTDCNDSDSGVHPDPVTFNPADWCSSPSATTSCSVCGDPKWRGVRHCGTTCQWSLACSGVTRLRTWNGDNPSFLHNCGAAGPYIVPDTTWGCVAGEWCNYTTNCEQLYGPYVSLPAGTYDVTFTGNFLGTGWLLYGSWLDFDVFDTNTNSVLLEKTNWKVNDGSQSVTLSVTIPEADQCHAHEFRENYRSGTFNAIDSVTVQRTSASDNYIVPLH